MDVTSLLNTAGAAPTASKPPRSSASPAITESGHTVPSSALPTPSPERVLGPAECERSPRQNPSLWGPRGYSLQLALDSKPRSGSVFSYQAPDGRAETDSDVYISSRNNSVCSAEVSLSSHSPRTVSSRHLLSPRSSSNARPNKIVIKSSVSPEQSDAEQGEMGPRNSAATSHSSQSTYDASSASRTHSRMSSGTTIGTLQVGKEAAVHHGRGNSLDHTANGPRNPQQSALRRGMSAGEDDESSIHTDGNVASKMHKRTMSAPDIAQCSVARMPRHAAQPMIAEIAAPRAPTEQTATDDSRHSSAAAEAAASSANQAQEAYCMFVKDCDTGSQLRKAISHLFGRNKACTLRIPKHVWVYYCRKHYQRIRYRNAKTYPLNQMELVKLQIMRLQAWSEDNRKQQNGAYIRMWTLSLRKREQSRIENGGTGVVDDAASLNDTRSIAGTAVPEWLIQRVASGYTTEEILDVAERLHKEIKDGMLAQVPEIEFLPDIVDADAGAAAKSARSGRRQSRLSGGIKTPKRKAPESLDFGRRDSAYSDRGASDYYHHHGEETYEVVSPSGKRARVVRPAYGPPRPDSAQLPPLASALSYGEMQPPPPPGMAPSGVPTRAPNVVPRIQPLEYRRGSAHYGTASPPEYYQGQPLQGPPRWDGHDSPHSARSEGAYALSNGEYRYANDMRPPHHQQQQPPPPHHGHQALPPISAQLDGRFPRGAAPGPPHPHHQAQHSPEPRGRHHWRSASAYGANDPRGAPPPGRPLSSGHEASPYHTPHSPPAGYPVDGRREYEAAQQQQHPPPPPNHHHHYGGHGPEHEQGGYTYSYPRGHHGSQPPPPSAVHGGHIPRHTIPPPGVTHGAPSPHPQVHAPPPGPPGPTAHGYAAEGWNREPRVAYGRP